MGIPASAKVVTFIHTRDRERAKAFYHGALGFPLIADDAFACVLDAHGAPLRITHIPDHTPNPHTVLGWSVHDIVETIAALTAAGVTMQIYEGFGQDAMGVWTSPDGAAKVAWFNDPDGNNLSLTQA